MEKKDYRHETKIFQFLALFLLFAALHAPRAACAELEAGEYASAVPPVEVKHDKAGDYVADKPFPQWIREETAASDGKLTGCSPGDGLIPEWARPLPVEPVRCAALNPKRNELWAATNDGLVFLDLENKRKLYFAGRRWLPANDVFSVGVAPDGSAVARTAKGDARIARRMITLEQKALYFENIVRIRHNREGMVSNSILTTPGDLSSSRLTDDDNDGQWTEMYLAAESFRYAATKDPEALRNARESFKAMRRLLTATPVKGYVARSVLPASQCPGRDSQNWRTAPSGDYCWKTDTSKDELIGHYFGLPIYYDLAADEADRDSIRSLVRDLTDYLAGNGFRLLDETGKVTTYGNLDPEWINGPFGKMGDQGLNSTAALGMARSAFNITADPKYLDLYKKFMDEHHYHINALKEKTISDRLQVNHDSDEMASLSFYTLINAERTDKKLRDDYFLEGMRRLWSTDLKERNAEQIIIYGAFERNNFGLDLAVRTLREIPLDLVKWDVRNSHRRDVKISMKPDRFKTAQSIAVLPYTETRTMRWSDNMYRLDVSESANEEMVPTFWLLPYWMARYYNLIR
ncbi:MAG TPA: hypothetical protein PLQ76_02460 [bacterium]|nr:hypothetical protein [bacterium]